MRREFLLCVVLAGYAAAAYGQATFEVASVRPNTTGARPIRVDTEPGGRFLAINVPVRSLIRLAYQLEDFQIEGAPSWIDNDRFDIVALAGRDLPMMNGPFSGSPELRGMVKSLLAERFGLVARLETREGPTYTLMMAREDRKLGEGLTPSGVDCAALWAKKGPDDSAPWCGLRLSPGMIVLEGVPVSQLAAALTGFVGRTITDETGLTGAYDLQLSWTGPQAPGAPPNAQGPSLFTALREQAGLKLEPTRGPVQVLVVERITQPTPN